MSSLLSELSSQFEADLQLYLEELKEITPLYSPAAYILCSGGKRLRPLIILLIAHALGKNVQVREASLSIEFFHTASLIADDLPCMDDELTRRGKRVLHREYDEATALLVSYSLIASGYRYLQKNGERMIREASFLASEEKAERLLLALRNVSEQSGVEGLQSGQFWDLNSSPQNEPSLYLQIIRKKTVSLFESAMLLGWLFGGGALSLVPQVKQMALHFGSAFQMADDLLDESSDRERKAMNATLYWGREETEERMQREWREWKNLVKELFLDGEGMRILKEYVEGEFAEKGIFLA